MKVLLLNHNEEYAVREMIGAFFPKIQIEYVSTIPQGDDFILSEYVYSQNNHTFFCECNIAGKVFLDTITEEFFDSNTIKKTIYNTLKKATGIDVPWGILTGIRPSKMVRELKGRNLANVGQYLTTSLFVNEQKSKLAIEVEMNEEKIIDTRYKNGISLYIGIPFCPTRCLYCSFTSQSVAFSNKLTEPYIQALCKEIEAISRASYIKNKVIETVYFGGGTPTAISSEQIDLLLSHLEKHFDLTKVKEITFEAGRPDTISKDKLTVLKKHGIERICINPQTINDKTLEIIGRKHSSEDFFNKYDLAKSMGFNHINCDIIAGLPEESVDDFKHTLNSVINLSPQSITIHTMSIKHGSYLDMKYGSYSLSSSNAVNDMLNFSYKKLTSSGKIPYYMYRQKNMLGNLENVGYCDKTHECIYNIYIMEEVQTIIALGAGGSTKIVDGNRIERVFNVKEVSEYINRIDEMIKRKLDLFDEFGN